MGITEAIRYPRLERREIKVDPFSWWLLHYECWGNIADATEFPRVRSMYQELERVASDICIATIRDRGYPAQLY